MANSGEINDEAIYTNEIKPSKKYTFVSIQWTHNVSLTFLDLLHSIMIRPFT